MDRQRLLIIDGYALLYRAFFATRYLSTSDGKPTNALFGFTSMLFTLLERERPHAVVVALDTPGKTFRHAEYSEYKATRKETQDELKVQLIESRRFLEALNIPTVELTGFEADDVVGTITRLAESNGYLSTVVTGDLDSLQLVDEYVSVITPGKGMSETTTYDVAAVEGRYGFGPVFVPDFKALKGDTSDNIPGVPGIGDKGAAELIQQFGTIEEMLDRFAELPAKYQKKIEGNEAQMRQSKWLATIDRNAPITYDFAPFRLSETQLQESVAVLESFEFRTLVRRAPAILGPYVEGGGGADAPAVAEVAQEAAPVDKVEREGSEQIRKWVGERRYAVFLPSAGARRTLFEETDRRAYIAVGSEVVECSELEAMELFAASPDRAILHDAKPAIKALLHGGASAEELPKPGFDTLLAAYVLRSERTNYDLRDLIQGYLDVVPPSTPEGIAVSLGHLAAVLEDRLKKEGQESVLHDVELPLVPILAEMEHYGIRTDRDQLREFSKTLEIAIGDLTTKIHELAGGPFTIGSPKQLGEVLFEKLGIPGATKTKTGYATGAEILEPLAPQYEIAAEVLNWRELSKLKSTYADSLERLIQDDGRIHTTYNQAVAATGRLSSNDPNLQNIPIRTELGRGIRRAFVAAPGTSLAALDYSQIELRVLAHMCEEPALVDAFQRRVDVHTVTAQQMFNLGSESATKEQRRLAKMLNYAVLYGVSEFGLAQQLGGGFSISEAKELIRLYNERFPTVKEFTNSIVAEARSKGFTTTLLGRRRYFADIHASRINDRKYAERQAMNAPIQGTAADMLKRAMIDVRLALRGAETRMLLNVHDELVFEVPEGEESILSTLRSKMELAIPLKVPVEVDAKVGPNWNEMTVVD